MQKYFIPYKSTGEYPLCSLHKAVVQNNVMYYDIVTAVIVDSECHIAKYNHKYQLNTVSTIILSVSLIDG
jgi:hypothetical protein